MNHPLLRIVLLSLVVVGSLYAQSDDDAALPTTELPENSNEQAEGNAGDWRGPSTFIRSHWVRLTNDGRLVGTIKTVDPESGMTFGAEELDVEVYRKGERLGQGKTDQDGTFEIRDLEPGVYSLVARGRTGFLAYGLQLLPSLAEARKDKIKFMQAPRAKEAVEITSAAVPPTFRQLKKILKKEFPSMQASIVEEEKYKPILEEAVANNEPGSNEPEGAEIVRGNKELSKNPTDPNKTLGSTSTQVHPVMLSPKNIMYGRLCGIEGNTGRPKKVRDTTVYIIRDDRLVTSAKVDENGFFKVYLRRPDVYSIIAAGRGGFGALSFRAVKPSAQMNDDARHRARKNPIRFVKAQQDDLLNLLDEREQEPVAADPTEQGELSVEDLLGELDSPAGDQATDDVMQDPINNERDPIANGDAGDNNAVEGLNAEPFAPNPLGLADEVIDGDLPDENLTPGDMQPTFDNFGNATSAPLCLSVIDDPQAIVQAFRPFVPAAQPMPLAGDGGAVGQGYVGGPFAPAPVGPSFAGTPAVMGGPVGPAAFAGAPAPIQPATAFNGGAVSSYYPSTPLTGSFVNGGGGGGGFAVGGGRLGGLLGVTGLAAGITSVAVRSSNRGGMFEPSDPLVSPFRPAVTPDPDPVEEMIEGEFFEGE